MKKEWLLPIVSVTLTTVIALGLIRWLAPGLLGIMPDLQLVQVHKKVPPFYDNIFRQEDYSSRNFIINDPFTLQRAKPLFPDIFAMGPNDILGFRNRRVPNVADIITIGDSQTYGNNALLDENWPNRLKVYLSDKSPVVYNMSCGAWNGIQYLEIFAKAIFLKPRVVVVAFYTGNDPLEAFMATYGSDRWKSLRLNPKLNERDAPEVAFPAPQSEHWRVRFKDGTLTTFTPKLRLSSNRLDNPAVQTGYAILKEVGYQISGLANKMGIPVVFTIIPTKELVYEVRIRQEGIIPRPDYQDLVASEKQQLSSLAARLRALPGTAYADLLSPLQHAARFSHLYPPDANGHPVAAGYDIIAQALAPVLRDYLPPPPTRGLLILEEVLGQKLRILVKDGGVWVFASDELVSKNGWELTENIPMIKYRDIAGLPRRGIISSVEPKKFGPSAFHTLSSR